MAGDPPAMPSAYQRSRRMCHACTCATTSRTFRSREDPANSSVRRSAGSESMRSINAANSTSLRSRSPEWVYVTRSPYPPMPASVSAAAPGPGTEPLEGPGRHDAVRRHPGALRALCAVIDERELSRSMGIGVDREEAAQLEGERQQLIGRVLPLRTGVD